MIQQLAKTSDKYEHNKISTKSCQNGNNRRIIRTLVTKTASTGYIHYIAVSVYLFYLNVQ